MAIKFSITGYTTNLFGFEVAEHKVLFLAKRVMNLLEHTSEKNSIEHFLKGFFKTELKMGAMNDEQIEKLAETFFMLPSTTIFE